MEGNELYYNPVTIIYRMDRDTLEEEPYLVFLSGSEHRAVEALYRLRHRSETSTKYRYHQEEVDFFSCDPETQEWIERQIFPDQD